MSNMSRCQAAKCQVLSNLKRGEISARRPRILVFSAERKAEEKWRLALLTTHTLCFIISGKRSSQSLQWR